MNTHEFDGCLLDEYNARNTSFLKETLCLDEMHLVSEIAKFKGIIDQQTTKDKRHAFASKLKSRRMLDALISRWMILGWPADKIYFSMKKGTRSTLFKAKVN